MLELPLVPPVDHPMCNGNMLEPAAECHCGPPHVHEICWSRRRGRLWATPCARNTMLEPAAEAVVGHPMCTEYAGACRREAAVGQIPCARNMLELRSGSQLELSQAPMKLQGLKLTRDTSNVG
ncbi:hypothetical protein CYMTET_41593 [Cymbomonas tetramitiformis]|uniref:Uncharacterized protein n=1 Tax=Cymbomonas tetramitiformis TaxID=36881 RepID=A0AAE0C5S0_9CHLO|nr:hypothetical protein CYMTET_41593 [Cymbomonas tetramitiformis]